MGPKKAPKSPEQDGEEEPPSKLKKMTASIPDFNTFLDTITKQRSSFSSDNFEKSRVRSLSSVNAMKASHSGILYWMSRDQRVEDNWALIYAQQLAIKEKVPLFVVFCLVPKFLQATLRQYAFMLKGLQEVRHTLHKLRIPFHLLSGQAGQEIPKFVKKYNIGGVVTDFSPLRIPLGWANEVALELSKDKVPLAQVDAHNVIPLWVTSNKQEYAARTIRGKIDKLLGKYLTEFPRILPHPLSDTKSGVEFPKDPFHDMDKLISTLTIDMDIKEVDWAVPGSDGAFKTLHTFINSRLKNYQSKRNDPNEAVLSNLSPYFHFGQISVARAALEVKKSPHKDGVAVFFEEAIVRRELSDNFCFYNPAYDSFLGAADWAKKTLNDHRNDKRPYLYTLKQFETAKTHDPLWNAAQNQLRIEGKMHGFLRMYWAKKILEWCSSPESALEISIYLNDRYNLDGRDPNGFVGCMWSICGIHDQGWREREVFGKIRYMNYEGCKRKFNVTSFEGKYNRMAKKLGLP